MLTQGQRTVAEQASVDLRLRRNFFGDRERQDTDMLKLDLLVCERDSVRRASGMARLMARWSIVE